MASLKVRVLVRVRVRQDCVGGKFQLRVRDGAKVSVGVWVRFSVRVWFRVTQACNCIREKFQLAGIWGIIGKIKRRLFRKRLTFFNF